MDDSVEQRVAIWNDALSILSPYLGKLPVSLEFNLNTKLMLLRTDMRMLSVKDVEALKGQGWEAGKVYGCFSRAFKPKEG